MSLADDTHVRPARQTRQGSPATRALLLEAGKRVLAEKSIFDANVEDFIQAAGVARGTFYIYFADKFDLLRDLTRQLVSQALSVRFEQLAQLTDPMESLQRRFFLTLTVWRDNAGVYRSMFQLSMLRSDFHEFRAAIQRPALEYSQREIEGWIASGKCRNVDPRLITVAIGRQLELLAMEWFGLNAPPYEDANVDDVARELAECWYHAIYLDSAHIE